MRIFAISDLHLDYQVNAEWFYNISEYDFANDILIIAGDLTDKVPELKKAFQYIKRSFKKVFFVPGNHDLWVSRSNIKCSINKFKIVKKIALDNGISILPEKIGNINIVPLLSWYDYTFGEPSEDLLKIWNDFKACSWPYGNEVSKINDYFLSNNHYMKKEDHEMTISFSHFLPRIDIMPSYIPLDKRIIYPTLGTQKLDEAIRLLGSEIHVYGHSHVNRNVTIDNVTYINNAYGYPNETRITLKELVCIYE